MNVVKWFPDGTSFVAGCDDGTVRLFDIRSARILNEYSYHCNYLNMNGTLNKTPTTTHNNEDDDDDEDGQQQNEEKQNNPLQPISDKQNDSVVHTSTSTPIVCSETEDKILHNGSDNEYDASFGGSPFLDDEDPTDGVATLDFSNSGAFMFVSYNNDKHKVLAWNVLTGDVIQELKHDGHVPSLRVSPHGSRLVTACWDHHLKLWM